MNNLGRPLLIIVLLACAASSAIAQDRSRVFIEPHAQALWLLDAPIPMVGFRIGYQPAAGVSLDFAAGASARSAYSGANGTEDYVRWLGRLSAAIRHNATVSTRLHLDAGAAVAAGLGDASHCGETDVCYGGGLYLEAGPEAGATFRLASRLGLRLSLGYALNAFLLGPTGGSPSFGVGLRFTP